MKKAVFVLVLLCAAWQWHQKGQGELVAPPEEAGTVVAEAGRDLLVRLGLREGVGPELVPVRMVHCVVGGVGAFVREIECRESGGTIDEPPWARTEG